ncbi:hypothetical protein [Actinomadura monticuli]|uniref:PD-(D/E)XK endonuclease-like domain-containing protein n=1 Tax=Actinomadura monticuli TaxID=3097367 RepID=A0ABV4Q623_9ACTN
MAGGQSGTEGASYGWPDLVVRGAQTPQGTQGYAVWDMKSAWGDGLTPAARAQVASYVYGIGAQTGQPTVLGHEIAPQFRYDAADRSAVTIFNYADWATYGPPTPS